MHKIQTWISCTYPSTNELIIMQKLFWALNRNIFKVPILLRAKCFDAKKTEKINFTIFWALHFWKHSSWKVNILQVETPLDIILKKIKFSISKQLINPYWWLKTPKKNFPGKFFAFLNAYYPKTHLIQSLNSLDSSKP